MKIIEGFRLRDIMGQATIIGEGVNQVDFNRLITLNQSAAYLWRSVEEKDFEISDLAELLINEYGIERVRAEIDAKTIAEQWMEVGLIKE